MYKYSRNWMRKGCKLCIFIAFITFDFFLTLKKRTPTAFKMLSLRFRLFSNLFIKIQINALVSQQGAEQIFNLLKIVL